MLLIVLNIRTYEKIVQFEQTLNQQTVRVKFHNKSSRRNNAPNSREALNAQSFEMVELVVEEDEAAAEFERSKNQSFLNRIKSKRFRGSTRLTQKRHGGTYSRGSHFSLCLLKKIYARDDSNLQDIFEKDVPQHPLPFFISKIFHFSAKS